MSKIAIGISGQVGAGKTTAGKALRDVGCGYTRISKVIDAVLIERGLPRTRSNHQEVGFELHIERGQPWLCREAIALLNDSENAFVLDGLRWPEDVDYMRERYGDDFFHIHISAREAERERRFESLGRAISYENVVSHPVEQEIDTLANDADRVILNNGSRDSFLIELLGCVVERLVRAG